VCLVVAVHAEGHVAELALKQTGDDGGGLHRCGGAVSVPGSSRLSYGGAHLALCNLVNKQKDTHILILSFCRWRDSPRRATRTRCCNLFEVVVERVEEKEQQLLGVLLGVVVELGEYGAHHRPGLHRGTAGAAPQPHLLQQAGKHLGHAAL